jgi:DNA (cytosine-5)-methyltransferase 1
MTCAGQVEIDKFCLRVLEHYWPDVKRVEDIRNVTGLEFGTVGLVCGGFPCQPFSCAGKRKGKADDRYLWPEMLRVIQVYRPTWVLGENVTGIIGVELDKVLADLEGIGCKTAPPFIIPACAVDAPHRRDRVWIVAHTEHDGRNGTEVKRGIGARNKTPTEPIGTEQFTGSGCGEGRDADVADAALMRVEGVGKSRVGQSGGLAKEVVSDGSCEGIRAAQWKPEPDVGRVAHGVPGRVDRLRSLGNAVVPQVVEEIGRAIMRVEFLYQQQMKGPAS